MSDHKRIKSRLNAALCAFVSVPLTALPAVAQDKPPTGPVGARKLGVRAIQGGDQVKPLSLRKLEKDWVGLRKIQERALPGAKDHVPGSKEYTGPEITD